MGFCQSKWKILKNDNIVESICKGIILLMGHGIKTCVGDSDLSMVRYDNMVVISIDCRL